MHGRTWTLTMSAALVAAAAGGGCRGDLSSEPPIHLNPNMDHQQKYLPQAPSPLFADGRAMRPEVPGTVARGELHEDDHLYRGLVGGKPAETLPVKLDEALLHRGEQRFNIYCAPCHDGAGTGDGIVVRRGMLPPPKFDDDRLRAMPVGQIFGVITHGVRNMPSYAAQIPVEDRWAIVAYVRALQVSRHARLADVPAEIAAEKGWRK
jgi:mono/diheme cytochrome c family protein